MHCKTHNLSTATSSVRAADVLERSREHDIGVLFHQLRTRLGAEALGEPFVEGDELLRERTPLAFVLQLRRQIR